MKREGYGDATLVLLGHGSTLNAWAGAPVWQHAAGLRRRALFAEVREAFWKQAPGVLEVLPELDTPRAFVVPLFVSEGYFAETVIPRALGLSTAGQGSAGRVQSQGGRRVYYGRPVGTHEGMTKVLLARAQEVVRGFPFPRAPAPHDTTLIVAGHGTEQDENSRVAIERAVESLRALGVYGAVHGVFLEEEPRVSACYDLAPTRHIVVVPFFISDGLHVREDIPRLLGEPEAMVQRRLALGQASWRNPTERKGKLVWCSASIGSAPELAEVILERVGEAAGWE